MSKAKTERALSEQEAQAVTRHLRVSPRKLNLVAQLIRGMSVHEALRQLTFSHQRIAISVKKALQSAVANAENNHQLNVDALFVKEAFVGKNLVMKRLHTRGRGKSARIFKPFANLTIVVRERTEEAKPVKAKKAKSAVKPSAKAEAKQPRVRAKKAAADSTNTDEGK